MSHENLRKKYGVSEEALKSGIEAVSRNLGNLCDTQVMLAVIDLLASGDIEEVQQ